MPSFHLPRVPTPRWIRSRWTIRLRSAVVSTVTVALALLVGGAALVWYVSTSASATVDSATQTRLQDITAALAQSPPDRIDPLLLATDQNIVVVQILDESGAVVRGSTGAPDTALTAGPQSNSGPTGTGGPARGGDRRPDRLEHVSLTSATVPTGTGTGTGTVTIVIGASDGNTGDTITTVTVLLAILAPIIAAIAGAATYYLVGRSLRSMERLRRRVSEISAADLTERLPVSENRDEIAALAETMNAMLERIETGQSTQRRFVSDASHELRSPLATIAGVLELGRESLGSIDADLLDHTLLPEVTRVQSLVEDLLVLARADENGMPIRLEDVDLDDIARGEAALVRSQVPHTVVVHLSPTRVHGDPSALTRVLRNLTVNAGRHASTRMEIEVRHDADTAYLEVGDDGPGIPEHDRVRVFDRFVRLEEHRSRAQGGAGLGLSIVAEIVQAHGGDVVITARKGGGTLVSVRLPFVSTD
ncbi:HAMP domain-containing sensor histidine kinase [Rhodococcoides yunnanense]|uniref:HAMP domain-containing sensor histidine kinase n=1 Tax=Rhodococcoides yunnanense TaxID=278209 RepID=UPI0009342C09|nr:HAMP domain-containing sensor histidine kinase [Rhodococcus yunnanensis]